MPTTPKTRGAWKMQRHAILITNSFFPHAKGKLGKLSTVPEDSEGMKSVLRDLRGRFRILPLPDMEKPEILDNIETTLRNVGDRDLVLIYYAGHGRVLKDSSSSSEQLLLATNRSGPEPDREKDLEFKQIESRLKSQRIRRALIVLDCCYSGAADGDVEVRGYAPIPRFFPVALQDHRQIDTQPADAGEDGENTLPGGEGVFIMTACESNELAQGNRTEGNGDFTRHFMESLKMARDQSSDAITVQNVFARIQEAMVEAPQTPTLIHRSGTADLELARPPVVGERVKRTLTNWKPLPKRICAHTLSMSPVYLLDSGFRFVHWNSVFEDVIARQLGLVLGAHGTEFVEKLDNKMNVEERNRKEYPMPDERAQDEAEESGEIWEGFSLTDIETLEFRSDRFGLIVFDKQAYQLPTTNFGRRRHWHVQLTVRFVQREKEYWSNVQSVHEGEDLWNEYAESYDSIIGEYPAFRSVLGKMSQWLEGRERCLDIGTGTGNMTLELLSDPKRHVTAIEFNDAMLHKCYSKLRERRLSSRVRLLRGDARTVIERMIEEGTKKQPLFDCCVMMNVLYVLDDPVECLRAIYRVLKPNSLLILSTPHDQTGDHVPRLFENIRSFHMEATPQQSKWAQLEKHWASAKRINEMLAGSAEYSISQVQRMLKQAQFELEEPMLEHEYEDCVLIAAARKPYYHPVPSKSDVDRDLANTDESATAIETEGDLERERASQTATASETTTASEPSDSESDGSLADAATTNATPSQSSKRVPVQIFVSYSREDLDELKELKEFLKSLKRRLKPAKHYEFRFWKDDENILVGDNWRSEIDDALKNCDIGLLLLSPGFLGSKFITEIELVEFTELKKMVVPVKIQNVNPEFDDLRGLDKLQIFRLNADNPHGLAYTECDEQQKKQFVDDLVMSLGKKLAQRGSNRESAQ